MNEGNKNVIAHLRVEKEGDAVFLVEASTGRKLTTTYDERPVREREKLLNLLVLHYRTVKNLAETEFEKL